MEERGVHVFVQKETGGGVVVVGDSVSRFDFRGILFSVPLFFSRIQVSSTSRI
jgi:hypothetical protein